MLFHCICATKLSRVDRTDFFGSLVKNSVFINLNKILQLWCEWDLNGFYLEPRKRVMVPSVEYADPGNDDNVDEDINMLAFFDLLTAVSNRAFIVEH